MKKEELKKQNYKEYLEQFKKEFEVHREFRIKETPILLNIFNEFIENLYSPTPTYQKATKMKCKLNEEMKQTFTQEQKELLEQWQYYEDRILDDMVEQAFVYGYAMAVATQEEATKKLSNK